jgi:Skp family chaperone for outer membrane proteins
VLGLVASAGAVAGQEAAPDLPIATLDQEALFLRSAFGQRLQRDLETQRDALAAENRRIETGLIAEEQALTEKRKTLAPGEFTPLAQDFDRKVESIRSEQDAKARALQQRLDRERQLFLSQVGPVLAEILRTRGALVLIDSAAVLIAAAGVDITDQAIAAIDARLGDGSGLDRSAPAGPAPGVPPEAFGVPVAPAAPATPELPATPGTSAPQGAATPAPAPEVPAAPDPGVAPAPGTTGSQ